MKCLILGSKGYLGRHLVQALRNGGHEVLEYSRQGHTANRVDVCDSHGLAELDWNVDIVFLFAGITGTSASFLDFKTFVASNEIALLNVLDCIRRSDKRPRLVFPSTRLVYKGAAHPLAETAELEARTVYAANKIACEIYLKVYARAFSIPYTVFRICIPYGNSQSDHYSFGTLGNFIRQALDSGCIRLYGDGSLRRTFTHVDDLCRSIVVGAMRDDFENEIFNVPGEDLSLLDVARVIATRLQVSIDFSPWPDFDLTIESGSTVFDGQKMLERLPGMISHRLVDWAQSLKLPNKV